MYTKCFLLILSDHGLTNVTEAAHSPSVSPSSSCASAPLTSLPVPRTKFFASPSPSPGADDIGLIPRFGQLLNIETSTKEELIEQAPSSSTPACPVPSSGSPHSSPLQPYGKSITGVTSPQMASAMQVSATTPLRVVIGEEDDDDAAQQYTIHSLGEDFLQESLQRTGVVYQQPHHYPISPHLQQQQPTHHLQQHQATHQQQPAISVVRRPQQLHLLTKRLSADVHMMMTNSSPSGPTLTRSHEAIAAPSATQPRAPIGHRRSSSHGNPTQLWSGISQQQSMPCIANLSLERPNAYIHPSKLTPNFEKTHLNICVKVTIVKNLLDLVKRIKTWCKRYIQYV